MQYIQYHIASGAITANVEMNPRFAVASDDGYDYLPGGAAQETHWVDAGQIAPRVPYDAHTGPSIILQDTSAVTVLTGLPDPCWVRIRGNSQSQFQELTLEVIGGSLTFKPEHPGQYVVSLEGRYSCADWHFEVVSLDQFKARRIDEVKEQKALALKAGVEWNGHRWDADATAQLQISGTVTSISAGLPLPEGFYWTSYDNVNVPVTSNDLIDLGAAIVAFNFAIHDRSRSLKEQIEIASSLSELDAIDVGIGWPS